MDRRAFITSLPIAGAAVVAGTSIDAQPHDPLIDLCDRYFEVRDAIKEADTPYEPLYERMNGLMDEISATPATTQAGLRAQWRFFDTEYGEDFRNSVCPEWAKIMDSISQGIEALV